MSSTGSKNASPWLSEDVLIEALLSVGQTTFQDVFILFWKLFLHIPFRASQDEWLDYLQLNDKRYRDYSKLEQLILTKKEWADILLTLCKRMTSLWQ